MKPRPVLHETETHYCETKTETETKQWSQDQAGMQRMDNSVHPY